MIQLLLLVLLFNVPTPSAPVLSTLDHKWRNLNLSIWVEPVNCTILTVDTIPDVVSNWMMWMPKLHLIITQDLKMANITIYCDLTPLTSVDAAGHAGMLFDEYMESVEIRIALRGIWNPIDWTGGRRVLAHEFGHAFGLSGNNIPDDLMQDRDLQLATPIPRMTMVPPSSHELELLNAAYSDYWLQVTYQ